MTVVLSSRTRFATGEVPAPARVRLWEEHNEQALVGLSCRMMPEEFVAEEVNAQVGAVSLGLVSATPHAVERDRRMIDRSPADSVVLYATLAGESFYYHRDGVLTTRAGQVVVCDVDVPFMRGFSQDLRELVVKIPRERWHAAGGGQVRRPRIADSRQAAGGDPYHQTLATAVLGMLGTGSRPAAGVSQPPGWGVLEESQLVALAVALADGRASGTQEDSAAAAVHLRAAQTYVERHLADPGLGASQVAAGVGLSERHLSRVLAAAGTSLPRYVSGRRVLAARRLLESRPTQLTVAEVAHAVGFTSAAGFARAFRAHQGATPSEVRRAALARTGGGAAAGDPIRHT